MKDIPYISYRSGNPNIKGIEIISMKDLVSRKQHLDHSPEKPHQLDFYSLACYTEGETQQLADFKWYDIIPNTLIFLSKGQVNAFKFKEDVHGYLVLFTQEYFEKQLSKLPKNTIVSLFTPQLFSPTMQTSKEATTMQYIKLMYDEYYSETDVFNKQDVIDALFTLIFSKIEQLKAKQLSEIKDATKLQQFIKFKGLVERDYTKSRNADYYAAQLGITYKHLNTICKSLIDSTAKQFIDELIILEAKRKLINSAVKSTELAYDMGFEEPTNFVKYFKKHTGLTPNGFKNNHI